MALNEPTTVMLFGTLGVAVRCLEWLLAQPDYRVVGVVCAREPRSAWRRAVDDRDMQEEAPRLGVPLLTMDDVLGLRADIGLSVRFHQLFRPAHLRRFRLGIVNLHGAPLPDMRGSMCDAMAIVEGRGTFGATLHWVDEGVDSGDVLAETRFPIAPADTVYDLFIRANDDGLTLIRTHLGSIVRGELAGVSQDRLARERGVVPRTYYARRVLGLKRMNEAVEGEAMWNRVRAFQFPGHEPAYAELPHGRIHYAVQPVRPPE